MRRALLLLLVLLPACTAAGGPGGSGGSDRAGTLGRTADARGVLEAVFRYQFEHNDSGLQERAAAYCLCVPDGEGRRGGERDPEPGLLELFRGRKPPVLPCSGCRIDGGRVVEAREGRPALTFRVASLRWLGRDEAEVEGGYGEGNLSASGQRFRVVRGEAGWKVADVRGLWVS